VIRIISDDGDELTPEERARHAETRARLAQIERTLFGSSAYSSNNILSPAAAQLNAAHEKQFALLREEREALLATLPPTGAASGRHLVIAGHLSGTTILRESEELTEVRVRKSEWDWSE
jgi:hypothetical protein